MLSHVLVLVSIYPLFSPTYYLSAHSSSTTLSTVSTTFQTLKGTQIHCIRVPYRVWECSDEFFFLCSVDICPYIFPIYLHASHTLSSPIYFLWLFWVLEQLMLWLGILPTKYHFHTASHSISVLPQSGYLPSVIYSAICVKYWISPISTQNIYLMSRIHKHMYADSYTKFQHSIHLTTSPFRMKCPHLCCRVKSSHIRELWSNFIFIWLSTSLSNSTHCTTPDSLHLLRSPVWPSNIVISCVYHLYFHPSKMQESMLVYNQYPSVCHSDAHSDPAYTHSSPLWLVIVIPYLLYHELYFFGMIPHAKNAVESIVAHQLSIHPLYKNYLNFPLYLSTTPTHLLTHICCTSHLVPLNPWIGGSQLQLAAYFLNLQVLLVATCICHVYMLFPCSVRLLRVCLRVSGRWLWCGHYGSIVSWSWLGVVAV